MNEKELRARVEVVQCRDRNLLPSLGSELTADLERVVDDLLVCKLLVQGRLSNPPPNFRRFAPSAEIAELALDPRVRCRVADRAAASQARPKGRTRVRLLAELMLSMVLR
jgi:hypothetical protein